MNTLRKIDYERELSDANEDDLPGFIRPLFRDYKGVGAFGRWLHAKRPVEFRRAYAEAAETRGMRRTKDGMGKGAHESRKAKL